jgi:hypothetical protein
VPLVCRPLKSNIFCTEQHGSVDLTGASVQLLGGSELYQLSVGGPAFASAFAVTMHNTRSRSLCKKKENLCVSTLHDGRPVSRYHPESVAIPNPPIVENTERHSGRLAAQRWDRANVADNRRVRQQEALGPAPEFIYRIAVRFSARIVRSWPSVDRMRCVELRPQHVTDRTRLPIYFHRARRTAVPPDVRRNSVSGLDGCMGRPPADKMDQVLI